jgi:hypothetical protein
MDLHLLADNLTNPALLFFLLGIISVQLKSDLEIPPGSARFISLYLLFSIGFKGGQELAHSHFDGTIAWSVLFGILVAIAIPFYSFFILKTRLKVEDAGAVAASYGSVSAVTFVTAVSFLEIQQMHFGGHMVAVMALMEAPAIVVGVLLIRQYADVKAGSMRSTVRHAFTNGSVLLILGSLVVGYVASEEQAQGIKPFTTDIFKGFLAIFLLDMGIASGKQLKAFFSNGWFPFLFAFLAPIINGVLVSWLSGFITTEPGDRFMLAVLAASASYIAVPAAMRIAAPKANPGLFLPMALAVTFPVNITLGMPLYLMVVQG